MLPRIGWHGSSNCGWLDRRHLVKLLIWLLALGAALGGVLLLIILAGQEAPPPRLPTNARADAIVIDKTAHTMTLYQEGQALRTYAVSLGSGGLEAKQREGDKRTPEGTYRIDSRNPRSSYHLSLHISYPDAQDVAAAQARGENAGSDIMIHGLRNGLGWFGTLHRKFDWTAGCIAVTNQEIEEIWRVVADNAVVEIRR